jgi:parallel beta-helix repeat protein
LAETVDTFKPAMSNGSWLAPNVGHVMVPGDTVVFKATDAHRTYFYMNEIHGTAACPIVYINEGSGQADIEGIEGENCSWLHITGTGDAATPYGFFMDGKATTLNGNGEAFNIHGKSTNIEVDHAEIYRWNYMLWMKQDLTCTDTTQAYPYWTNQNSSFHDSYGHNIGQDAVYWDNTSSNGYDPGGLCGGVIRYPEHSINGKIYNLIIDSTNRTGIQASACDGCEIYNNTIRNLGYEYNQAQGAGISLGSQSSNCYVHDNNIKKTFAPGIFLLAHGNHRIYRNTVDSAGMLYIDSHWNIDSLAKKLDTALNAVNPVWNTSFYHMRYDLTTHILYNTYSQPSTFCSDPTIDALSDPAVLPYLRHAYDSTSFYAVSNVFGEAVTIDASYNITHNVNENRFRVIDDGVSNKYDYFNYQCGNVKKEDGTTAIAVSNVNSVHIINSLSASHGTDDSDWRQKTKWNA